MRSRRCAINYTAHRRAAICEGHDAAGQIDSEGSVFSPELWRMDASAYLKT